jgi:hypothetical protein
VDVVVEVVVEVIVEERVEDGVETPVDVVVERSVAGVVSGRVVSGSATPGVVALDGTAPVRSPAAVHAADPAIITAARTDVRRVRGCITRRIG